MENGKNTKFVAISAKSEKEEIYSDFCYYRQEVKVCRVSFMSGESIYVSAPIGKEIQNTMEKGKGSEVIRIGGGAWRVYELQSVIPMKARFCELSEWAKNKILIENPKLFSEWYNSFSPRLQNEIKRLRKGKDLSQDLKIVWGRK